MTSISTKDEIFGIQIFTDTNWDMLLSYRQVNWTLNFISRINFWNTKLFENTLDVAKKCTNGKKLQIADTSSDSTSSTDVDIIRE